MFDHTDFSEKWIIRGFPHIADFEAFLVALRDHRVRCGCRRELFLTSLEPLHGFASNVVWMFLGWTPTEFVKIGVLPQFFMELWVILCNFCQLLKNLL